MHSEPNMQLAHLWFAAPVHLTAASQIKAKWDPEGFFSKPFTVQPAKA
jgi:hypothetical protein